MLLSVDSSKANIAGAVYLASLIIAARRLSSTRSSAWPICSGFGSPTEFIISSPSSPIYIPTRLVMDWKSTLGRQYLHGVLGRQGIKALGQGVECELAAPAGLKLLRALVYKGAC